MAGWYTPGTWADLPSQTTPINKAALDRIEGAIAKLEPASFSAANNLNGRFAFYGDSQNLFGEGWPGYVCALSNAAIRPVLVTSYAGWTAATMLTNVNAEIINVTPKVGICVIQVGANEAQSAVTLATYRTNIIGLVDSLRAAGITPILTTVLPNANATYDANVRLYNAWLRYWCPDNEVMLVDTHAAVANSAGGWLTGMADADGLHPAPPGHYAMAQVFVNALTPVLPPRGSVLIPSAGSPNLIADSVNLVTGWASTGITPTLLTDSIYGFKWARITGSGTTVGKFNSPEVTTGYVVGDILRFSARMRSGQTIATVRAGLQIQVVCYNNAYTVMGNFLIATSTGGLSQQIFDGVCAREFTVPTGTTKIIATLTNSNFDQTVGQLGTYDMALPSLVNLTTLGIVP